MTTSIGRSQRGQLYRREAVPAASVERHDLEAFEDGLAGSRSELAARIRRAVTSHNGR